MAKTKEEFIDEEVAKLLEKGLCFADSKAEMPRFGRNPRNEVKNLLSRFEKVIREEEGETQHCHTGQGFLVCYCGKCEPECYKLPKDFNSLT